MELNVANLSCGYGKKEVIRQVTFSIKSGEVLCVLGANGCGKTTLFKGLMQFLPLFSGEVLIDGKNAKNISLNNFAKAVSYIPQNHIPAFSYTVAQIALMGRTCYIPPFASPTKQDEYIVDEALRSLNITHLKNAYYTEISGGERRLALIARTLCQQAKIIIMDEPGSDLDYANQLLMEKTILDLKEQGYGIIFSTHAPEYPFSVANKALILKKGIPLAFGKTLEVLTETNFKEAYGVNMQIAEITDKNGKKRKMCLTV